MSNFKDLEVWQRSRRLVGSIYVVTRRFPKAEQFGLSSQLRRAAVSILSNLAEGSGRGTDGEFLRFLRISRGSCSEIECQLIVACDLGYVSTRDWTPLDRDVQEIARMLTGLMAHLARKPQPPRTSD